ncbi:hypothetical protein CPB86DRAFT_819399 [Serendipita vermifera]|nr:hypothetical protein CPB86DRAFT_819399 [Serendipita vermifera]
MSRNLAIILATVALLSTVSTVCASVADLPHIYPVNCPNPNALMCIYLSDVINPIRIADDKQKGHMNEQEEREQEDTPETHDEDIQRKDDRISAEKDENMDLHEIDRKEDQSGRLQVSMLPAGAYGQVTFGGARCSATRSEIFGRGPSLAVGQIVDGPQSEVTLVDTKVWVEAGGS